MALVEEQERDPREEALNWLAAGLAPHLAAVASDEANVASGVLVLHESRYLAVTVGHMVRRIHDKRSIRFLCAGRLFANAPDGLIGMVCAEGEDEYPDGIPKPDLGVIELRREFATGLEGVTWVTTDRISFDGAAPGREVAFIGFPAERVRTLRPVVPQTILAPSLFTTALRGELPSHDEERYLDERFDFLAPIPNVVDGSPVELDEGFAERLSGISGAGVFLLPREDDDPGWSPARAQLVGLQRGVLRSRRFVFHNAIVIRRVLDAYLESRPPEWPS
jgi:hypothetical protein